MIEAFIGLVGVVVGALLTATKDIWIDRRTRRENAEYLAIRVVSILDQFVEGCAEVAGDDGLSDGQRGENGERDIQVSVPKLAVEQLDVQWKAIPATLLYKVLSFPNLLTAVNRRVDIAFEYAHPPDYEDGFEERQYQYATLGLKAAQLSNELRNAYGLPKLEREDWDPIKYLRERQQQIEAVRARKEAQREKLL